MKRYLFVLVLAGILSGFIANASQAKYVYVSPYMKEDGTYVNGHYRWQWDY